ncbi:MAG: DUF4406 domain-containing protein [Candidatus Yanofskybacteria bacterium]|nr:DUF4406 domain-containing protein [Candidatus Yanofskybacteria bacterium]
MRVVGIVGPYFSGGNRRLIDHNIANALYVAIRIANYFSDSKLVGFFCLHNHTANFEKLANASEDYYYALDDVVYDRVCDGIIVLPGWEDSKGSVRDFERARDKQKSLFILSNYSEESLQLLLKGLEVWALTPEKEVTQVMLKV